MTRARVDATGEPAPAASAHAPSSGERTSAVLTVVERDGGTRPLALARPLLVVVGFTGRDPRAVAAHVDELRAIGIPAPAHTPTVFVLPDWLLSVGAARVDVPTPHASGEAEPVLVVMPDGDAYVGVGSDHTDRILERASFGLSKIVCPKPMGAGVWPLADVEGRWDELRLESRVDDEPDLYQDAPLTGIRAPRELLALVNERVGPRTRPLVLFLGTVPVRGVLRGGERFAARLVDGERALSCAYAVDVLDPLDADLLHLAPSDDGTEPRTGAVPQPRREEPV